MSDEQSGRRPSAEAEAEAEPTVTEEDALLDEVDDGAGAERGLFAWDAAELASDDEAEIDDLDLDAVDFDDLDDLEGLDEGITTSALRRVIDGVLGRVLSGMDVRRVYGEPLTQGEVTVVPVAEIRYGFGFGGGGGEAEEGEGGGAGGGGSVAARPLGFLELRPGGARFEPIVDVTRIATAGTVVGGLALLIVLRRLLR